MDALNLCLHIVEASNGCFHLIQLKQMGNMTHLLTCAHNHKMLVSAKKIEKLKKNATTECKTIDYAC